MHTIAYWLLVFRILLAVVFRICVLLWRRAPYQVGEHPAQAKAVARLSRRLHNHDQSVSVWPVLCGCLAVMPSPTLLLLLPLPALVGTTCPSPFGRFEYGDAARSRVRELRVWRSLG